MKIQPAVRKETLKIAAGTTALSFLMLAVFWLIGKMDGTVVLGAIYGTVFAVLNFFLMALAVQKAAEKMNGITIPPSTSEEDGEETEEEPLPPEAAERVQQAKQGIRISYTLRMLLLVAAAIIALVVPVFNTIAALLPLLFPRIVIFLTGIRQSTRKEAEHQ